MKYYSTNKQSQPVSLEYAVLKGLADDGGLYMPEYIPKLPGSFFKKLHEKSFHEIAFSVASAFFEEDVPADVIKTIVGDALNFPVPVVEVENDIYCLELFHGPTMSFKDFGARFMSRLMTYLNRNNDRELTVIVATSGDTGGAAAAGFYNVPGIKVYILFPKNKVSPLQQKQFTTWGGNITAIEVDGTFDDCQRIAKQLLSDRELNNTHKFTSANSINIARIIPQSFYYFSAFAQLQNLNNPVVFSVPSGNFGNLTGGLLAAAMGLPVQRFIAATNANDVFLQYLQTGIFQPRTSVQTISNAMDVGQPGNFARMCCLFDNNLQRFLEHISGYSFTDDQTRIAMQDVHRNSGYVLDPHGAIGYMGLKRFLSENKGDRIGVFLETAHPAKFREIVKSTLVQTIEIPHQLKTFMEKREKKISVQNNFDMLKSAITN